MAGTQVENLETVVDSILDSVDLAMKGEGITEESREEVIGTVEDSVGNHSEELLPYIKE